MEQVIRYQLLLIDTLGALIGRIDIRKSLGIIAHLLLRLQFAHLFVGAGVDVRDILQLEARLVLERYALRGHMLEQRDLPALLVHLVLGAQPR